MFFQHAKLFPTSGALPLLFPPPEMYVPQTCTFTAASCAWTCSSNVKCHILRNTFSNFSFNSFQVPITLPLLYHHDFFHSSYHYLYLIYWFVYLLLTATPKYFKFHDTRTLLSSLSPHPPYIEQCLDQNGYSMIMYWMNEWMNKKFLKRDAEFHTHPHTLLLYVVAAGRIWGKECKVKRERLL